MKVTIYTDGAARSNPEGPGGYGTVIHYTDGRGNLHVREYSAGYKKTTNNRMELMAVIAGLEALTKPCDVEVISDSKYVTEAFNSHWVDGWIKNNWRNSQKKPVLNVDLWKRLLNAMGGHNVSFTWVKGHAGHPENERCDYLATNAADSDDLLDDVIDSEVNAVI
ncbi:MAG: ribonuclease HI [Lachnospiraceae bacterium]|nr:ribonuclease HI [Lachnospiraceae bacterium]